MSYYIELMSTQTARNLNSVFDSSVITQQTVSNRLAIFRTGNFDFIDEARSRRINGDELKVTVVFNSSQNVYELSLKFGENNSLSLNEIIPYISELSTNFAFF